jgi:competence protein ComFC
MIKLLKHLFFVRTCLGCGMALPDAEEDTVFCADCLARYQELKSEECLHCGKRADVCRCTPQSLRGKVFWSAHLFSYYGKLSKRIVFTLKMKNYKPLQRFLAKELADLILEATGGELDGYTIAYAPRKFESVCIYGFDQAKILARLTASRLRIPVENLFRHAHFTKIQKRLNAVERKKNAQSSYSLNDYVCRHTDKLLIFDDIVTTGSTLSALVTLAEAMGFREIAVISVAKTG